ncbi:hypothetical protein QYF61_003798 [Mycteria americana]|uniref:Uncharacterized protein n=1 Tax=Mycteria americana TaxID=33587 RepID=A0AAN7PBD8_MYCAM|nr:hypothetical protein QYF61_003798 [Mycteria americana]
MMSDVGGTLLPQSLSCGPSTQEVWEERLPVKTEAKKLLRTSAFSSSVVTSLPKPFLLFFASLAKFSSSRTLAFLTPSLHNRAASLYSSQDTCPCFHCLCISFLPFSLTSRSRLSHARLLPSFPDFLHLGIESSCTLWKASLKTCQLCSAPLSLRAVSQGPRLPPILTSPISSLVLVTSGSSITSPLHPTAHFCFTSSSAATFRNLSLCAGPRPRPTQGVEEHGQKPQAASLHVFPPSACELPGPLTSLSTYPSGILTSPAQHQAACGQWAACLSQDQVVARPFYILYNITGFHLGAAPDEAEGQLLFPGGLLSDLITGLSENSPSIVFCEGIENLSKCISWSSIPGSQKGLAQGSQRMLLCVLHKTPVMQNV